MSALPYLPWFVGDYLADTLLLTRDQHGGYLLLLATMWNAGGSLPNDPAVLAQVTKASPKEWEKLAPVLLPFFTLKDGRLTSKRLSKELARTNKVREARREASQQGVIARALKKVGVSRPHEPNGPSIGQPNEQPFEEPNGQPNTDQTVDQMDNQTDNLLVGISRKSSVILTTVESLDPPAQNSESPVPQPRASLQRTQGARSLAAASEVVTPTPNRSGAPYPVSAALEATVARLTHRRPL